MSLLTTFPLDTKTYGFEWLRYVMLGAGHLREGVRGAGDFKVTAAAAGGMRVDVAAGLAIVQGDTGTRNGLYGQVNDATIANAVTLAASHASLPRIDSIVLTVNDSADLASGSDTPTLGVVAGTPTAGATLDNRNGANAIPNNTIWLADVLVPAASVAVTAGNVRDKRQHAAGRAILAALPTDPAIGQEIRFQSAAMAGLAIPIVWGLVFDGTKWLFTGGNPRYDEVNTGGENVSSTTYTDLTTVGPQITLPLAGDYDVEIGGSMRSNVDGDLSFMSYQIGGTGATDADSVQTSSVRQNHLTHPRRKTGLAAVSLVAKYKATGSGPPVGRFYDRWMRVTPVRLG